MDKGRPRRPKLHIFPTLIVVGAAALAFAIGVGYGTFAAADTDPYGYVSQAELVAGGALRVDQRYALSMPWREAEASFVPAGYKQAPVEGYIVPTYPIGLPLVMAALLRVTGAREAVFYAVPLLGALLIWTTGRLGGRIFNPWMGAAASRWLVVNGQQ